MKVPPSLITSIRVLLGTILLVAGATKLSSFNAFIEAIVQYDVLPVALTIPLGYLLLSAEITVGAALILGYFSRGAALIAGCLFVWFALAIASVLWRKLPLDECGCGNLLFDWLGLSAHPSWKAVGLDLLLSLSSFLLARITQQGYGVEWFNGSFSRTRLKRFTES